jgi:hypothetical protein
MPRAVLDVAGCGGVEVGSGHATLSPLLFFILIVCGWLFHPWLFLIWYGYKTIWWYAVGVLAIGFVFQLLWTKIGIVTGAVKNAWAISLIGIPIIPALFFFMVTLTLWSTETSSLLEVCRRCPL